MARADQPWTQERIQAVVQQVAPIVYLDKHEIYRPSSVEWYLRQVELVDEHGHVVIEQGKITSTNFPGGEATKDMYLEFPAGDGTIEHGCFPKCSPDPAVAYVHVRGVPDDPILIDVQYWFFYPFNGGGTLHVEFHGKGLDIPLGQAGEHQGDWEHVTVRANPEGQIIGVYCSQHSDGQWYWEASSPGTQNGYSISGSQPVIYSAKNGHPSYPWVGTFPTEGSEFSLDLNEILSRVHISWSDGYLVIEGYLVNETSQGQLWNCADRHQIVAIDEVPGVDSSMQGLPSWWWLKFLGRWGLVHVRDETKQEIVAGLAASLGAIVPGKVAKPVAEWIVDKVLNVYGEISPDGPTAPLSKDAWKSDGHGLISRRPSTVYQGFGPALLWQSSVSLIASGDFETDQVALQLFYPSFDPTPRLSYFTFKNGLYGGHTGPLSITDPAGQSLEGLSPCAVRSASEQRTYLFYLPPGDSQPISYTTREDGGSWSHSQTIGGIEAQGRLSGAFLGETLQLFYQPPGTHDLEPAIYDKGQWSHPSAPLTSDCRGGASAVFYQDQIFVCWRDHDGRVWYRTVRSDQSLTDAVQVETGGGWSPNSAGVPQLAVVDDLLYLVWVTSAAGSIAYLYFDGTEWQPFSAVVYGNFGQNDTPAAAATVGSSLYLAWPSVGYVREEHRWLDLLEAAVLDV